MDQRRPRFARFTLRSDTVTQRVSPSHSSAQTRPGRHCATVPTERRPRFFRFRLRSDTLTQLVSPSHRSAQTRPEGHAAALTAGVVAPIGSEIEIAIRAKSVWWMRMISPSLLTFFVGLTYEYSVLFNHRCVVQFTLRQGLHHEIGTVRRVVESFEHCTTFDDKRQFLVEHVERIIYDRYGVTVVGSVPIKMQFGNSQEIEMRELAFCLRGEIDKSTLHKKPRKVRGGRTTKCLWSGRSQTADYFRNRSTSLSPLLPESPLDWAM